MNVGKILKAARFAALAHHGQERKYTGEPYIVHPLRVGQILVEYGRPEEEVLAGIMHDVLEDTPRTPAEIKFLFGADVMRIVEEVTDVAIHEDGNRTARCAINDAHVHSGSNKAHNVKCADIMANLEGVEVMPPKWALEYLYEKRNTVIGLTSADPALRRAVAQLIDKSIRERDQNGKAVKRTR